jgi:hypothetical protein
MGEIGEKIAIHPALAPGRDSLQHSENQRETGV